MYRVVVALVAVGLPVGFSRQTSSVVDKALITQSWSPDSSVTGEDNFCAFGKVFPRLFVLGAPKCATTSFYMDALKAGVTMLGHEKEYGIMSWLESHADLDTEELRQQYLKKLPDCSVNKQILVANFNTLGLEKEKAPSLLKDLYVTSSYPMMAEKIFFVALLREPLARMQSHYYMDKSYYHRHDGETFQDHFGTFQQFITQQMETNEYGHGEGKYVASFYGQQLHNWRESFSASQFFIVPYRVYGVPSSRICETIVKKTKFRMKCEDTTRIEENTRSHPSLEEDTTKAFRERFANFIKKDHETLMQILTHGTRHGMSLAYYPGEAGNRTAIEEWLQKWW